MYVYMYVCIYIYFIASIPQLQNRPDERDHDGDQLLRSGRG